jgi:1,4-dihydroxy-2-naphthoyl-CoA hydrolase
MDFAPPIDLSGTFDGLYGLEFLELNAEVVRGRVPVVDKVKQPAGLVHGGVYASIAESMASWGTGVGAPEGSAVMGLSNQTSFLRPITSGTIHAIARIRHRGRTTCVWEVEITDDDERLCALVRMTIAIRPRSTSPPGAVAETQPR